MYNCYVEGRNTNGVSERVYLGTLKTIKGIKARLKAYQDRLVVCSYVIFFEGCKEARYRQSNYRTIERTGNAKTFYEFWD